jgi:radical SAM protein with 4Fe4S-binding SPASM domain
MSFRDLYAVRLVEKVLHIPAARPYDIQVDISNICNLDCKMCARHFVDRSETTIAFDNFKKIIDRLGNIEEIALVGLGEPFMHPQIFEAIKYCKDRNISVKITTNGLLLDSDEMLERILDSGLDFISFSIDSIHAEDAGNAHENSSSLANIKRLLALRNEKSLAVPKIVLQTVMFKDPANLYEVIQWGAEQGVDRINVMRVDHYFDKSLPKPDLKEEKAIFKQLAVFRQQYNLQIDCIQDQVFSGLKGRLYKIFKHLLRLDSFCHRLTYYTFIAQNGNVQPCWLLDNHPLGNIFEQSIEEIWHGEKYRSFRKNHLQDEIMCRRCDYLCLKQGEDI